jgi:hypothetical protein
MRLRWKIPGLLVALAGVVAPESSYANRLSVSNQQFTIQWPEITFTGDNGTVIRCRLTLEGSFHSRTIAKSSGLLVGHVTRGIFDTPNCPGFRAMALSEDLPWHVTYQSFSGSLPRIVSLQLLFIGVRFLIEGGFFTSCLGTTTLENPMGGNANREAGGAITALEASGSIPVSGGFCPASGITFSANGAVFLLGTTNRITLTLI